LKIFLSYRRENASTSDARLLYDRLTQRFGQDDVYFDVKEESGLDWAKKIRSSGENATAFLALIGTGWTASLRGRRAGGRNDAGEDFVRREIEWALRDWPGFVIPVLIDTAMPEPVTLPRSLRGLCRYQAAQLRHDSFDSDIENLIERLDRIGREGRDVDVELPNAGQDEVSALASAMVNSALADPEVPAPKERHYPAVVKKMLEGKVVPVLGASVRGALPDADLLARHIAQEFDIDGESWDLAEIAQYVAVTEGESELFDAMKQVLSQDPKPTDIHRFFADYPRLAEALGAEPHPQMIVTASYDTALERAFEEANEPFDYAVYSVRDGWFIHFPWGAEDAEPLRNVVDEPQKYADFPIDDEGELERTLIVKINGAVDGQDGPFKWKDNYVVTEDQYIDYLPTDNVNNVVPFQILDKLKSSRCLFLGYSMRGWNARVFVRRIWRGESMSDNSWAVESAPDILEKSSWRLMSRVELLAAPLPEYVGHLRSQLEAMQGAHV
jgi:hypothetical protein